ncbi:MAG: DUF4339 domain-containing protein [Hyphomonadaceae bacterium]|nr:DUF4339 domain-containing protein [Hyphomonadaceae bacterium]
MADAHWYVVSGEDRFGPLTDEEVRRLLQYEAFGPHALAWKQGEPAWAALAQHFPGPETPTAAARKPTGKFRWLTLPALLLTLVAAAALAQTIMGVISPYAHAIRADLIYAGVWGIGLVGLLGAGAIAFLIARGEAVQSTPRLARASIAVLGLAYLSSLPVLIQLTPTVANIEKASAELNEGEISYDADTHELILEGTIGLGFSREMGALLRRHPDVRQVVVNSEGGLVDEALDIGKLIARANLKTYAQDQCLSACVIVFLSAHERAADADTAFGFHAEYQIAAVPEFVRVAIEQTGSSMRAFLEDKGVPEHVLVEADKASPNQMVLLSAAEMSEEGLLKDLWWGGRIVQGSVARWAWVARNFDGGPEGATARSQAMADVAYALADTDGLDGTIDPQPLTAALKRNDQDAVVAATKAAIQAIIPRVVAEASPDLVYDYIQASRNLAVAVRDSGNIASCASASRGRGYTMIDAAHDELFAAEYRALAVAMMSIDHGARGSALDGNAVVQRVMSKVQLRGLDMARYETDDATACSVSIGILDGLLLESNANAAAGFHALLQAGSSPVH